MDINFKLLQFDTVSFITFVINFFGLIVKPAFCDDDS